MSFWVSQTAHTLTEDIPAAPDTVRDFYVDLDNIKVVHPLVVSVQTISRDVTSDGYVQTYRVRDRIPWGMLALRVSYWARVEVPEHGDVHTEARQFPGVRLNGTVTFEQIGSGTRLTERLRIASPRPLAAMTRREALTAHAAMLSGIRSHFQGSAQ